jgi:hypothetical protein
MGSIFSSMIPKKCDFHEKTVFWNSVTEKSIREIPIRAPWISGIKNIQKGRIRIIGITVNRKNNFSLHNNFRFVLLCGAINTF